MHRLLQVLTRLRDAGNTLVIIEHNLDVIKTADYMIDLGPEGGDEGGRIVVTGTPEQVAGCAKSHTGAYLAGVLGPAPAAGKKTRDSRAASKVSGKDSAPQGGHGDVSVTA